MSYKQSTARLEDFKVKTMLKKHVNSMNWNLSRLNTACVCTQLVMLVYNVFLYNSEIVYWYNVCFALNCNVVYIVEE